MNRIQCKPETKFKNNVIVSDDLKIVDNEEGNTSTDHEIHFKIKQAVDFDIVYWHSDCPFNCDYLLKNKLLVVTGAYYFYSD